MAQRKYTLPRHTNLAKQSSRIGAFLVDLAFSVLASLIFFFGCFNLIVKMNPLYVEKINTLNSYELKSHLLYEDNEGKPAIYTKDDKKETFAGALEYYYLKYLTGEGIDKNDAAPNYNEVITKDNINKLPKDYYTISWYNYTILGITDEDPDREKSTCYFTYKKDDQGNYLKDRIGIPRDKRYNEQVGAVVILEDKDIVSAYQVSYVASYAHLQSQNFYMSILDPIGFFESLSVVLSFVFGTAIIYILLPYILKDGKTPGKKFFKLGLASMEGFKFKNSHLWLRYIPLFIVSGATLLPFWNGVIVLFVVYLVIFLVSFALAMASPKKCALHDFVARTIVIDSATSILFENELEEEEYILAEDGLVDDGSNKESDGEEPGISYEKY